LSAYESALFGSGWTLAPGDVLRFLPDENGGPVGAVSEPNVPKVGTAAG
jgi:hypothetical protein